MKHTSPINESAGNRKYTKPIQNIPDDIMNFVIKGPDIKWKHKVTNDEAVLSYNLNFSAEKNQEARIKMMMANNSLFDVKSMKGAFSVAHSQYNTRLESHGKTIHGSEFIYITDKDSGFVYIEKTSKGYLHFGKDKADRFAFKEKLNAKTEIFDTSDPTFVKAVLHLTNPGKFRYELLLDKSKEWKSFRSDVFCMAIGCKDKFSKAGIDLNPLSDIGIPVEGELFYETSEGKFEKISSFKVTDLALSKNKSTLFDIPKGYINLRKINKNEEFYKKNYRQGPEVRLSEYRKNNKKKYPLYKTQPGQSAEIDNAGNGPTTDSVSRFQSGSFNFPTCFEETYGAKISNLVDEKILDDIKYYINAVSKRLNGFSGSNGTITIDWMNQIRDAAQPLDTDAEGGGLYTLLHDEAPTNEMHLTKFGFLDRLAVTTLSSLLEKDNNLIYLGLPTGLQARVNTILANSNIAPEQRFVNLTIGDQGLLVDAYIFNGLGKIKIGYPSSFTGETIFDGFISVRLYDVDFDIDLGNQEIVDTLKFENDGIHLIIKLPDVSGTAWVWIGPTEKYWLYAGMSGVLCFLFPVTCFLMGVAITVGLFLALDIEYAALSLKDISIDSKIKLVPDNLNILRPEVELTLDASVSFAFVSVIPDGLHVIFDILITTLGNHTDILLDEVESIAKDQFQSLLSDQLNISYPPKFGPVPLVGIGSSTEFVGSDYGYIEQALNAGLMGIINPYITQIDALLKPSILQLRTEFKSNYKDPVQKWIELPYAPGHNFDTLRLLDWADESKTDLSFVARYYLGTVLSQNFINDYVYTLWRRSLFNYNFTALEAGLLFESLKQVFPFFSSVEYNSDLIHAHLWPAVPPRTIFTPRPASEREFYSTTIFDDLRICFEIISESKDIPAKFELAFTAQANSEIGFGGYNQNTGKLDLLRLNDRAFDIYFDLKNIIPRIIHPESQYYVQPNMRPSVYFNYSYLYSPLLQQLFSDALSYSLSNRNADLIPRSSEDPMYLQRYPLGNDAVQVIFQLVPYKGNLYISKGLSGLATAALSGEGSLDIDVMTKNTALTIIQNIPL